MGDKKGENQNLGIIDKQFHKLWDYVDQNFKSQKDFSEEYNFSSSRIEKTFEGSGFPIVINQRKLIHYTAQKLIPAPKRVSIGSAVGGSMGKYKAKTILMLIYINELKQRGVQLKDMPKFLYSYFSASADLPGLTADLPLMERIIRISRENDYTVYSVFDLLDFPIFYKSSTGELGEIPGVKLVTRLYFRQGLPYSCIFITKRNLTDEEYGILMKLREDKEYRQKNGIGLLDEHGNELEGKYNIPLRIFPNLPLKKDEVKGTYTDQLNTDLTFTDI